MSIASEKVDLEIKLESMRNRLNKNYAYRDHYLESGDEVMAASFQAVIDSGIELVRLMGKRIENVSL